MAVEWKRAALSAAVGAAGALTLRATTPSGLPTPGGVGAWLAGASTDEAVLDLAWGIGWLAVGWASAIALFAAGATVPGALGAMCRAVLRLIAPRAVRRLLEAALGVSLLAGPALGGAAFA